MSCWAVKTQAPSPLMARHSSALPTVLGTSHVVWRPKEQHKRESSHRCPTPPPKSIQQSPAATEGRSDSGPPSSLFCDTGGRGGVKSWRRQALFQGRHCFCPTPTLWGGGVRSRRQAPTHRLVHSTHPISNHMQCNRIDISL